MREQVFNTRKPESGGLLMRVVYYHTTIERTQKALRTSIGKYSGSGPYPKGPKDPIIRYSRSPKVGNPIASILKSNV